MCKSSQELEWLQHENEDLQMQFFQQGKELISRNKQSLAAEMENASKEEVHVLFQKNIFTECLALYAYAVCLGHLNLFFCFSDPTDPTFPFFAKKNVKYLISKRARDH